MHLVGQGVAIEVWGTGVTFFIKKAYCYHLLICHLIYMFCCCSHLVFLLSKQMLFSGLNATWILQSSFLMDCWNREEGASLSSDCKFSITFAWSEKNVAELWDFSEDFVLHDYDVLWMATEINMLIFSSPPLTCFYSFLLSGKRN